MAQHAKIPREQQLEQREETESWRKLQGMGERSNFSLFFQEMVQQLGGRRRGRRERKRIESSSPISSAAHFYFPYLLWEWDLRCELRDKKGYTCVGLRKRKGGFLRREWSFTSPPQLARVKLSHRFPPHYFFDQVWSIFWPFNLVVSLRYG